MSRSGANTALRAPITTSASPDRIRRSSAARSAGASAECHTATRSPRRARRRPRNCGVSAISGTSTRLDFPRARAASMARRYTSVLPDPVTPCSSRASTPSESMAAVMRATAAACPSVSVGGVSASGAGPNQLSPLASARSAVNVIWPSSAMRLSVGMVVPATRTRSAAGSSPPRATNSASTAARRPVGASAPDTARATMRSRPCPVGAPSVHMPSGPRRSAPSAPGGSTSLRHVPSGLSVRRPTQRARLSRSAGTTGASTTPATGCRRPVCVAGSRLITTPSTARGPRRTATRAPGTTAASSAAGTA